MVYTKVSCTPAITENVVVTPAVPLSALKSGISPDQMIPEGRGIFTVTSLPPGPQIDEKYNFGIKVTSKVSPSCTSEGAVNSLVTSYWLIMFL